MVVLRVIITAPFCKFGWHPANSATTMVWKERALWLILHEYAPEDICKLLDILQRSVA